MNQPIQGWPFAIAFSDISYMAEVMAICAHRSPRGPGGEGCKHIGPDLFSLKDSAPSVKERLYTFAIVMAVIDLTAHALYSLERLGTEIV